MRLLRAAIVLLLMSALPASADRAGRVLLIRGLLDYLPGISPMESLAERLRAEGYDVTMVTHLAEGYIGQRWDAVIGHSQGAISALRDAPVLARANPHIAIIALDPPPTSALFGCVPGARYLDLHTGPFGLGGGSLNCATSIAMGGLHVMLPMRTDAQDRILDFINPAWEPDWKPQWKPAATVVAAKLKPPIATAAAVSFKQRWAALETGAP